MNLIACITYIITDV